MADELIPTISTSTDTIDYLMPLVLNAITGSDNTRHVYRRHLERFWEWYTEHRRAPLSKAIVREYLMYLQENGAGAATYNQALAVLRLLAAEAPTPGSSATPPPSASIRLSPRHSGASAQATGCRRHRHARWLSRLISANSRASGTARYWVYCLNVDCGAMKPSPYRWNKSRNAKNAGCSPTC